MCSKSCLNCANGNKRKIHDESRQSSPKNSGQVLKFKAYLRNPFQCCIAMANFQPITHGKSETALPNSLRAAETQSHRRTRNKMKFNKNP